MQLGMIDKLSSRFDRTVPKAKSCGTVNVRHHVVVSAGGCEYASSYTSFLVMIVILAATASANAQDAEIP